MSKPNCPAAPVLYDAFDGQRNMSLRNALHKAAGLFVELPDSAIETPLLEEQAFRPAPAQQTPTPAPTIPTPTRTVEQIVRESPGPNLDEIKVPAETVKQPTLTADGVPDFKVIFSQAGVPAVTFGASEAMQVVASLPAELPLELKRQAVGATLSAIGKTTGITTETILADASRKLAALSSFSEQLTAQTHQYQQAVQTHIEELKAQIADCEAKISQTGDKLTQAVQACEAEGKLLDDVLEFFTLDVAPSKHA